MCLPEPGASQEKRTFLPGNESGSDLFCSKSALCHSPAGNQSTYMSDGRTATVASNVEVLA